MFHEYISKNLEPHWRLKAHTHTFYDIYIQFVEFRLQSKFHELNIWKKENESKENESKR